MRLSWKCSDSNCPHRSAAAVRAFSRPRATSLGIFMKRCFSLFWRSVSILCSIVVCKCVLLRWKRYENCVTNNWKREICIWFCKARFSICCCFSIQKLLCLSSLIICTAVSQRDIHNYSCCSCSSLYCSFIVLPDRVRVNIF